MKVERRIVILEIIVEASSSRLGALVIEVRRTTRKRFSEIKLAPWETLYLLRRGRKPSHLHVISKVSAFMLFFIATWIATYRARPAPARFFALGGGQPAFGGGRGGEGRGRDC